MDTREYFETYGHDMEIQERRQKRAREQQMEQWLRTWGGRLRQCCAAAGERAAALAPEDGEMGQLAHRAAIYALLSGLIASGQWDQTLTFGQGEVMARYSFTPWKQLLRMVLDDRTAPCTAAQAEEAMEHRIPLYREEGVLTEWRCGTFWQHLIAALSSRRPGHAEPDGLAELLTALAACYAIPCEEEVDDQRQELMRLLAHHWPQGDGVQTPAAWYTALRGVAAGGQKQEPAQPPQSQWPRGNAAELAVNEDAVRRWDFSQREWAIRDFLAAAFPQAAARRTPEELEQMLAMDLLADAAQQDPALAVAMMKRLLDTAQDHLSEPDAAQQLLGWEVGDLCRDDRVVPLLETLKHDERLARQLFQSAYVGREQDSLLEECESRGEEELGQHLQQLRRDNPYG